MCIRNERTLHDVEIELAHITQERFEIVGQQSMIRVDHSDELMVCGINTPLTIPREVGICTFDDLNSGKLARDRYRGIGRATVDKNHFIGVVGIHRLQTFAQTHFLIAHTYDDRQLHGVMTTRGTGTINFPPRLIKSFSRISISSRK